MAHRTRPALHYGRQVHQLVAAARWRRSHRLGDAPGGGGLPRGGDLARATLRSRPGRCRAVHPPRPSWATALLLREGIAPCDYRSPTINCGAACYDISPSAVIWHPRCSSPCWSPAACTPTSGATRSFSWWREKPTGRSAPSCVARDRVSGGGWPRGRARTSATSGPAPAVQRRSCSASRPSMRSVASSYIPTASASPPPACRANPPWLPGLIARGYRIHCGFDGDEPGDAAASHMLALHPTVQRLRPPAHDWNDVLASR